jgi:AAA domain/Helicase
MYPAFKQAMNWEIEAQDLQRKAFHRTPAVDLLDAGQATGPFQVEYDSTKGKAYMVPLPGADADFVERDDKVFLISKNGEPWRTGDGKIAIGAVEARPGAGGNITVKGLRTNKPGTIVYLCKEGSCLDGCRHSDAKKNVDWPALSFFPPRMTPLSAIPGPYLTKLNAAGIKAFQLAAAGNDIIAIKGPPGTGKSHLLGFLCNYLANEKHQRILVTSKTHNAVNEVLGCCHDVKVQLQTNIPIFRWISRRLEADYQAGQIGGNMVQWAALWRPQKLVNDLPPGCIVGCVVDSAFYAPDDCVFDVIILDEASQLPMFSVAGLARLSDRFVLAGDDDQLPPILSAEHLRDDASSTNKTAAEPALSGLTWLAKFRGPEWVTQMDLTHRLNDENCAITGDTFYGSNLKPGVNRDSNIVGLQKTMFKVEAGHLHCLNSNEAEADRIVQLIQELIGKEAIWDQETPRKLTSGDIAVLTPYRKQAALLRTKLQQAGIKLEKVGTVDIMQGQSRAVVIFGVTTSDIQTLGERAEWLFSLNRWNVAVSRAKCAAFVVGRLSLLPVVRPLTLKGVQNVRRIQELVGKLTRFSEDCWETAPN